MKALILTAGLGTRLRPLTESRAKPSLPVVGIPAMWFSVWHMNRELGISEFALNLSHAPDSIKQAANDLELKLATKVSFHYSDETTQILGSSGALWKLKSWIGNELLAASNGDSISFPSWKKMKEFHQSKNALVTLHVRKFSDAAEPYTDIKVDASGRVTQFGQKSSEGIMFSGSYLFEPELLSRLPNGVSELRPTILEPLVREGRLFAFREDLDWFDTGTIATYAEAQFELLDKLPKARELVEKKMRELQTGVWVPKNWKESDLKFEAPVILTGEQKNWNLSKRKIGPHFIGLERPPIHTPYPTENAIIFSEHIHKL